MKSWIFFRICYFKETVMFYKYKLYFCIQSIFSVNCSFQLLIAIHFFQVNGMNASFPWLDFQYADPEPNFDRSKVLGVAAKLFTVKDHSFCVALDTVAGGKVSLKKENSSICIFFHPGCMVLINYRLLFWIYLVCIKKLCNVLYEISVSYLICGLLEPRNSPTTETED